jgi:uncharacterized membrane protein YgaE (UPF0421/DUF939 family)
VTEKTQDKTWIESQDVEFVNNLNQLIEGFNIAIRQNGLMVRLFNEYGEALHNILNAAIATENDNISNTNSAEAPAPANRAERRAKKTPFDTVKDKNNE